MKPSQRLKKTKIIDLKNKFKYAENVNSRSIQTLEQTLKEKQANEVKFSQTEKNTRFFARKLKQSLEELNKFKASHLKITNKNVFPYESHKFQNQVASFMRLLQKFFILGSKYEHGIDKEKNLSTAMEIYHILAEEGDIDGIERYWSILFRNLLGKKNFLLH